MSLVALREELHVRAENGGSVVGPLVLGDDGDRVDCAKLGKGGYSVPSIVEPEYVEIRRCTADFVLLVEKGTQWNRLSEDKFWRRYNCVLLTGNGQPPRGVRRLARRLHEEYRLPVYVLVDNDPWGYYIYSVVKQGSINLAFESQRMAIPKAKFIGLSSADPERYELPRNVGIKLNEKDIARAKELLNYQWFQKPAWQAEIKRMLASGLKYELDALANKDFQYLTKKYLPRKLKKKDWLDLGRPVLFSIASCRQYLFLGQQQIEPDHNDRRRHIHRLLAEAIVDAIDQDRGHEGEVELSDSPIPCTMFLPPGRAWAIPGSAWPKGLPVVSFQSPSR